MHPAELGRRVADALARSAPAALVAMFTYWTASRVPFVHESYWAPIAAVVVLYPDRAATRRAAIERLVGTIIGSAAGWACTVLGPGNLAVYGLAVLVAVGACHLLALEMAARLCGVAVTVITLVPHSEAAHVVALLRFAEVTYGVLCAVTYTLLADWVRRRRAAASERAAAGAQGSVEGRGP